MGYYVHTTDEVDFFLSKEHFDSVYQKMCELNDYHDLKRGGSFGNNNDAVEGDRYPRNKWFSWMEYNYPETKNNLFEILQAIGFEYTLDDDGNMIDISYPYDKTGNEEYFLCCFAGFVKDNSYIEFKGEDESYWRFAFTKGKMIRQDGEVEVKYNHTEVYEFGKLTKSDEQMKEYVKSLDKVKIKGDALGLKNN